MSRWKPGFEYIYYFVTDYFEVDFAYYINTCKDIERYEHGNMFQTVEEAEQALEMVKELFLSLHGDNDNN